MPGACVTACPRAFELRSVAPLSIPPSQTLRPAQVSNGNYRRRLTVVLVAVLRSGGRAAAELGHLNVSWVRQGKATDDGDTPLYAAARIVLDQARRCGWDAAMMAAHLGGEKGRQAPSRQTTPRWTPRAAGACRPGLRRPRASSTSVSSVGTTTAGHIRPQGRA